MSDAVLYARISPRSKASAERNESIPEQIERMRSYADAMAMTVLGEPFADSLVTGTSWRKRPAFLEADSAWADLQEGKRTNLGRDER